MARKRNGSTQKIHRLTMKVKRPGDENALVRHQRTLLRQALRGR